MGAMGIVRNVDDLGRIVLPKELRRMKNINEGDSIEIFVGDNTIILHKYQPTLEITNDIERVIANLLNSQCFMQDEELKTSQEAISALLTIQEMFNT